MSMVQITPKRSFIGNVYYWLIRLSGIKNKLAKSSFRRMQSFEDVKTPLRKRYAKEAFAETAAYWINPEKRENGVLVFLPGGGFVIGPSKLHWLYCEKLAKKLDMSVLLVRYALAPEKPFPIGLNGITEMLVNLQQRGFLQKNWFLAGDSSGGNLTLATCYELYRVKAALPKKIMLLYPSVDMNSDHSGLEAQEIIKNDPVLSLDFTKRVLEAYAGKQKISEPLLSPVNGKIDILPPILLQHGTADILIRGSVKLVGKLEAAGKPVFFEKFGGMFHGFILIPGLPEAKKTISSQVKFLKNET